MKLTIKRRTEMRRYLRLGHKVDGVFCFLCHFLKVKESSDCVLHWGKSKREGKRCYCMVSEEADSNKTKSTSLERQFQ